MSIYDAGYPFITAYLKGEEARLITREHIDRLMRVNDIPEAVEVLKGTDIGDYLGGYLVKTFDETDERLWLYLDISLKHIAEYTVTPADIRSLKNAYVFKYDVRNIKAALLGLTSSTKAKFIPLGIMHETGLLTDLTGASSLDGIVKVLNQSGLLKFGAIAEGYQINKGIEARLKINAGLDREYYRNLLETVRKMPDRALLAQAIGMMLDLNNLKVVFRATAGSLGISGAEYTIGNGYLISADDINYLLTLKPRELAEKVPYTYRRAALEVASSLEKNRSITIIDEIIDREEFRLIKELLSLKMKSPSLIIWYTVQKEAEIKNLRMIFKYMFDHHPLEEIRNYLVVSL